MSDFENHATNLVDVIYGNEVLQFDDPTENWFEATKIYRESMGWDAPGVTTLLRSEFLQHVSGNASRKYDDFNLIPLKKPEKTTLDLEDIILSRYSADRFSGEAVSFEKLSTILLYSYGNFKTARGNRRPIPSGGALYPLDIYILVNKVDGLEKGIYHYDPYRNGVVLLKDYEENKLGEVLLQEEAVAGYAFSIVISATFWRSRFKYGHRSSRFIFLEAGHLMQNLITLSTAHEVASRPYGGFIDDELSEIIGQFNGVDDAPIYTLVAGMPIR